MPSAKGPLLLMAGALGGLYLLTRSAKGASSKARTLHPGSSYLLRLHVSPELSPAAMSALGAIDSLTSVLPVWSSTLMLMGKTPEQIVLKASPITPTHVQLGSQQTINLADKQHTFTLTQVTQTD